MYNSQFKEAFENTIKHEGGFHRGRGGLDLGGMTYRGISRRFWGSWEGWDIIDSHLGGSGSAAGLKHHVELMALTERFYEENYWLPMKCGEMPQEIANIVFDFGVNAGADDALPALQEGLNLLNNAGELYSDIAEDGRIGPATLRALRLCAAAGRLQRLCVDVLARWVYVFHGTILKHPEQEKNYNGWLKRISMHFMEVFSG